MIEKNLFKEHLLEKHSPSDTMKLCVCVRKRPIFNKEMTSGEIDAVSSANPQIKVLFPKVKVDGITKYVDEYLFTFDNTFNENESTEDVYNYSLKSLMKNLANQGFLTMFAYGQTGSGKTFTMKGITENCTKDLFDAIRPKGGQAYISFFEIYGGKCLDLLNGGNRVQILEDGDNQVQIQGLSERIALSPKEMSAIIESGHQARTTHQTVANDTSSRSHAICQVIIRDTNRNFLGKLIMCDLAGSERAQDTQSNNRQRRLEGAEINKSLLALKECIRAMNDGNSHIPFRASKLTLALRDSFLSSKINTHIVMIACICPGSTSADHSINTLRYADRLKGKVNRVIDPKDAVFFKKGANQVAANYAPPGGPLFEENEDYGSQPLQNFLPQIANPKSPYPAGGDRHREPSAQKREQSSKKKEHAAVSRIVGGPSAPNANRPPQSSQQRIKAVVQPSKQVHAVQMELDDSDGEQGKKRKKDDLQLLKKTLRQEKREDDGFGDVEEEEVIEYGEKVDDVLDMHDEILALHMNILREDANFLSKETDIYSRAQKDGFDDDLEKYVESLDDIVQKKIHLYTQLSKKIKKFKTALKEEEEIHSKVRGTFYS